MGKQVKPKITNPEIRSFKIDDLNPAPYNPRRIDEEALDGLGESLKVINYLQHIVVNIRDDKNVILGGHQRYKILRKEGIKEIDCVVVDVDLDMEKIINVSLNNREIEGDWDLDKLEKMLAEINDYSSDLFDSLRLKSLEESLDLNSTDFDDFDNEDDDDNKEDFTGDELSSFEIEMLPEHYTIFLKLIEKESITFKSPAKKVQYGLKLGQFLQRMDDEGMI
jgi:hypothetical protein